MERDGLLAVLGSKGLDVSAAEIFLKNMEDFYGFLNKSKSSYIFSPKFLTRPDFYIKHQVLIFKNNGIDCVKLIKHEMSNSKYFLYKGTVKTILDHF